MGDVTVASLKVSCPAIMHASHFPIIVYEHVTDFPGMAQILQGQQVTCNLELDGLQHRLLFSDQREWHPFPAASAALPAAGEVGTCSLAADLALSTSNDASSNLTHCVMRIACLCPSQGGHALQEQSASIWQRALEDAALPDFTLAGPLELVLPDRQDVALHLPHSADVGRVRRLVLAAGAAVTVHGARSLALRRPLDLPALPDGYLANVWGRSVNGTAPAAADSLSGVHAEHNHASWVALRRHCIWQTTPHAFSMVTEWRPCCRLLCRAAAPGAGAAAAGAALAGGGE